MQPQERRRILVEGRRMAPAGYVLVSGLVCLALATFLNSASLLKTAQRQPLGTTRSLAVGLMEPISEMSGLLFLDRPRETVDRALGRAPTTTTIPTQPSTSTVLRPVASGSSTSPSPPADTTSTGLPPASETRPITPEEPMMLWIIGDSFVELFGPALRNDSAETGVIVSEVDFRFISGLVRFDYFDWPAHIRQRLPELQPDAVVVMFGGNDGQPMTVNGRQLQPDTPEWIEVYHELVGEAMDALLTGTTRVYWVGLPIMRDDRFTARAQGFNAVYRAEAEKRPGASFVDIFDLFKDEDGKYSTYLRTDSGNLLEIRTEDGAHFTWNGAYRLSGFVLEAIAAEWGFTDRL